MIIRKSQNQDYGGDVIKHPNHINPHAEICVLESIALITNKIVLFLEDSMY